jgi:hypothetical protein
MTKTSVPNYSQEYIESCFFIWYQNRDKHRLDIVASLPESEDGNVPPYATVRGWKDRYGWDERADALDAEVAVQLEHEAVTKKAEAIKKLAKVGESLVDKGIDYIMSKFVGMGEFILGVSKMNDQQLTKEFYRLMGKGDEDVIDAENEDVIDKSEDDNS